MVLVEGAQPRVHVGHVLPGLRDQHRHRVQEVAAGGHEQVESFVQGGGVGADRPNDRYQLMKLVAPDGRCQLGFSRPHPVAVAHEGIDLAVVSDETEGLGEIPVRERVGCEALVEEGEPGARARVREVSEEAPQLRGDHQPLVDDGTRRHRDDVCVYPMRAEGGLRAPAR